MKPQIRRLLDAGLPRAHVKKRLSGVKWADESAHKLAQVIVLDILERNRRLAGSANDFVDRVLGCEPVTQSRLGK